MRQIYLDLFSGVAGDMLIAGLLDAGAPQQVLSRTLEQLPKEFTWRLETVARHGIAAKLFTVESSEGHVHRKLADVMRILQQAGLTERAFAWAEAAFRELAVAEGRCHNLPPEKVRFHEVGAMDALVDIGGACALLDAMNPQSLWASPPAVGSGWVQCAHGKMPVPAPGTLELLRGMPFTGSELTGERTTPTGAALLKAWKVRFGSRPAATPAQIGYGAGARDTEDVPNLLRVWAEEAVGSAETLCELRVLIDDQSGEVVGAALEEFRAVGAVEAFALPAIGKKGRPAFEIYVLCHAADQEKLSAELFDRLGTLGHRIQTVHRIRRPREVQSVVTPLGELPFKMRRDSEEFDVLKPEFDALCQRARELGITPREALRQLSEWKESKD